MTKKVNNRKNFWFTEEQVALLDALTEATEKKGSEVIREAMILYANKLGIKYDDMDAVHSGRPKGTTKS